MSRPDPSTGWARALGAAAVVLSIVIASACGTQEEPVEHPAGSRAVVVNRPTPVGEFQVVATRVRADAATISVVAPGEPVVSDRVAVGDEATIGGFTFELVAVDIDDAEQPKGTAGGDETAVWILPR